jgi:hypothetical protein
VDFTHLFGWLGSRRPQETDNLKFCPRFFMCVCELFRDKKQKEVFAENPVIE